MNLPKNKILESKAVQKLLENPSKIFDLGINIGLAVLSYNKMGKSWESALFGPVSYQLARSKSEVAGTAGVIGLSALGVASILPALIPEIQSAIGEATGAFAAETKYYKDHGITEEMILEKTSVTMFEWCPTGYQHRIPYAGGLAAICVKVTYPGGVG